MDLISIVKRNEILNNLLAGTGKTLDLIELSSAMGTERGTLRSFDQ